MDHNHDILRDLADTSGRLLLDTRLVADESNRTCALIKTLDTGES